MGSVQGHAENWFLGRVGSDNPRVDFSSNHILNIGESNVSENWTKNWKISPKQTISFYLFIFPHRFEHVFVARFIIIDYTSKSPISA
jgi:hypothetical protein